MANVSLWDSFDLRCESVTYLFVNLTHMQIVYTCNQFDI